MAKKNYKIKNADTITDAEIEISMAKMTKLPPTLNENGKLEDAGYSVKVVYRIYSDETNLTERKPIPITETRRFLWDGKADFDTLALSEF